MLFAHRFVASTGFLETLKTSRFTEGFQTLNYTKWCVFAKMLRSFDISD